MDAWEKTRVLLVVSAVAAVALILTAIGALITAPRNAPGVPLEATGTPTLTPTRASTVGVELLGGGVAGGEGNAMSVAPWPAGQPCPAWLPAGW
ncbi:MAG: hypothetical protein K6V36_10825 [Anaerolineae bacterium]|nr:hypothetical protein [Anaerolineae bacterium]